MLIRHMTIIGPFFRFINYLIMYVINFKKYLLDLEYILRLFVFFGLLSLTEQETDIGVHFYEARDY